MLHALFSILALFVVKHYDPAFELFCEACGQWVKLSFNTWGTLRWSENQTSRHLWVEVGYLIVQIMHKGNQGSVQVSVVSFNCFINFLIVVIKDALTQELSLVISLVFFLDCSKILYWLTQRILLLEDGLHVRAIIRYLIRHYFSAIIYTSLK
jgi:hypothetical protein